MSYFARARARTGRFFGADFLAEGGLCCVQIFFVPVRFDSDLPFAMRVAAFDKRRDTANV